MTETPLDGLVIWDELVAHPCEGCGMKSVSLYRALVQFGAGPVTLMNVCAACYGTLHRQRAVLSPTLDGRLTKNKGDEWTM